MDPNLVRSLLDDLLDTAVASLTDPPPSQYVAHGSWAWDCEAVVAHLVRLGLDRGDGRGVGAGCSVMPTATVAATVLRCYPMVSDGLDGSDVLPSPAEIETAARALAVDGAALAGGIAAAWADGSLFSSVPCGRVTILPGLEPLGPSGGLAGWRVTLDVRL